MTKLALLLGAAVTFGFWGAFWFYPGWGLAGLLAITALLWCLTREPRSSQPAALARTDGGPVTEPASEPPRIDERRHWHDLPVAVRERLGAEPGPRHEIWSGVRPDPAGEARTEWRVVDARGQIVRAFWLDT